MSASEKLGAFMADERWGSHDSTVLAGLALTLKESALPQLLAVVEAAEHLLMGNLEDHFFTDYRNALHLALVALNESLEEHIA